MQEYYTTHFFYINFLAFEFELFGDVYSLIAFIHEQLYQLKMTGIFSWFSSVSLVFSCHCFNPNRFNSKSLLRQFLRTFTHKSR